MNADNLEALSPDRTIAGIVPTPNATITAAPFKGDAVVAAIKSAL